MNARGLSIILVLAAGITAGCAKKSPAPVATYTPDPPKTGLHVLDNRQPLARKFFAKAFVTTSSPTAMTSAVRR